MGKRYTERGMKIATERAVPMEEKVARDRDALRLMGRAKSWEFAQKMGCSEQTAKNRLRRLFEHGQAERFLVRGQRGWSYVTAVVPKDAARAPR